MNYACLTTTESTCTVLNGVFSCKKHCTLYRSLSNNDSDGDGGGGGGGGDASFL